jgi:hypothetical protein
MMRAELFDEVGLFDPALPVCEDYDLWLRVTARMPVSFISEPLIIKRGGHEDQLSQRSWGNDRFRVTALVNILESGILDEQRRRLTVRELHRKCLILANGYQKRGKSDEAQVYRTTMQRYPL